jgi:hypothetical protein
MKLTDQDWHRMTSRIRKPDGSIALADLVHELRLTYGVPPFVAIRLVRDWVQQQRSTGERIRI